MKFEKIVDLVDEIEKKFSGLTDSQLGLVESMLEEGADREFDLIHHLDYLVEFVSAYNDNNSEIIAESVDCGEVLDAVLDSARKNSRDMATFISEAMTSIGELDTLVEEGEKTNVTLLSVVTNTLTEMLGEEAVEQLPAEMVFDIVKEAKNLDISDDTASMSLSEMVEEISDALKEAITSGEIDFDSDDYVGETLEEFLDDYEDVEDLLTEMEQITNDVLRESVDRDGARLMKKAKEATALVESECEGSIRQRLSCIKRKTKAAKKWFTKQENISKWSERHKGASPTEVKLDGKLKKIVNAAKTSFRKRYSEKPSDDMIRYLWIPGIIKRMRKKHKHFTTDQKKLKTGQGKVR